MNADLRVQIEQAIEDTTAALMSVLTFVPNPYHTILLPVPTLQAYLSRIIGLIDLLPEIHQSPFHIRLEKQSTEFTFNLLGKDDYLMFKYLREQRDFQNHSFAMLELLKEAQLTYGIGDTLAAVRKMKWEVQQYPGLKAISEDQLKRFQIAQDLPLDNLMVAINKAKRKIANYQGFDDYEDEKRLLKSPEFYTIASAKARSLQENTNKYLGRFLPNE